VTVTLPEACARRWELPADPGSAAVARSMIRQALLSRGFDEIADDVLLMAGELVANAVTHGGGPVTVELAFSDGQARQPELACAVSDSSPRLPEPGQPGLLDESGRGLAIVARLAAAAGARRTGAGKTAWFRVRLPEGSG
jgi:anti-sigma regulatory factor (Ser/Thr protein kinase)